MESQYLVHRKGPHDMFTYRIDIKVPFQLMYLPNACEAYVGAFTLLQLWN